MFSKTYYFYSITGRYNNNTINDLVPNLIIEVLSILVIIAIIENLQVKEKEKERKRLEKLALKQLREPLTVLAKLSLQIVIVSQPKGKVKRCDDVRC